MRRERTAGVSPRDGIMEVAFEQWTEHIGRQTGISRLQRFPALQGLGIGIIFSGRDGAAPESDSRTGRVQRKLL